MSLNSSVSSKLAMLARQLSIQSSSIVLSDFTPSEKVSPS